MTHIKHHLAKRWKERRPMDFMKVLFIAVCVLGTVQFIKGLKIIPDTWPTWAWGVMDIPLLVGFGAIMFLTPTWVQAGALALSVMQLGYENVMQPIKKLLGM